jgi:hypothetical protein
MEYGYFYVKDHQSYNNVYRVGYTNNLFDSNRTNIFTSDYYIFVVKIEQKFLQLVDKNIEIQLKRDKLHRCFNGGTKFYDKSNLIDTIKSLLEELKNKNYNFKYKIELEPNVIPNNYGIEKFFVDNFKPIDDMNSEIPINTVYKLYKKYNGGKLSEADFIDELNNNIFMEYNMISQLSEYGKILNLKHNTNCDYIISLKYDSNEMDTSD